MLNTCLFFSHIMALWWKSGVLDGIAEETRSYFCGSPGRKGLSNPLSRQPLLCHQVTTSLRFTQPHKIVLSHQIAFALKTISTSFMQRDQSPKAILSVTQTNTTLLLIIAFARTMAIRDQQNFRQWFSGLIKQIRSVQKQRHLEQYLNWEVKQLNIISYKFEDDQLSDNKVGFLLS